MRSLVILADAFGFHYMNDFHLNSKLLFSRPLESLIGYSPGIYASIWSSARQSAHGVWTQWVLSEEYEPTPIHLDHTRWIAEYLLKGVAGKVGRRQLHPAVPSPLGRFFKFRNDISSEKPMYGLESNSKTIFEHMDDFDISYRFISHSLLLDGFTSLEGRVAGVGDSDVAFVSIGDFDHLGHKFGPKSLRLRQFGLDFLNIIDHLALTIGCDVFVFADHGMHPIYKTVDIHARLNKLERRESLVLGKDYLYFLDGTLLRMWLFTNRAGDAIRNELGKWDEGNIMGEDALKANGLQFNSRNRWRHGDVFFLAKPCVGIYPSFWHPYPRSFLRGLHGYSPKSHYSYGAFLSTVSTNREKQMSVYDVAPTIASYLGLPNHPHWIGSSFL